MTHPGEEREDWLLAELERAAEESRATPEWARPVITTPIREAGEP